MPKAFLVRKRPLPRPPRTHEDGNCDTTNPPKIRKEDWFSENKKTFSKEDAERERTRKEEEVKQTTRNEERSRDRHEGDARSKSVGVSSHPFTLADRLDYPETFKDKKRRSPDTAHICPVRPPIVGSSQAAVTHFHIPCSNIETPFMPTTVRGITQSSTSFSPVQSRMNPSPAAATSTVLSTSKDSFNKFPSPSKEFCVATSSASLAYDSMPKLTRTAIVPTSLPFVHGPYVGLSQAQATLLAKERISFPPNSLPLSLSPRGALYPSPIYSRSAHFFGLPPTIVRPIPTSGLPWPLHPVPLRVPFALRPDFGVRSPEEIPSPPGSALPDMPTSPLMGVRSPGLDAVRGLSEGCLGGVDVNNNSGICMGDGEDDDGSKRSQGFKVFLESAKIRVEMINDGNGLKNPLLSAEKTRLPLDNGPLSFMTLDAFPACPVCGMKCDTPRLLQRHVRSHKEIKRYLCAWCGKGFNDTFDLKRHTRTHTGVRPYKCEACGKAFTQRCSLESHSRKIHGQALPFTFNERRAKLYVCEECGHSTSNIESHFRHLRAQHPGHPALGRPHHDRRQYKFCGEDGEMEEGEEEEEEGGEGMRMEEGEEEEGGSWGGDTAPRGQFQNETAVTR